jgi:hypothetical protein
MRGPLIAGLLWTVVVFAIVLLWPGAIRPGGGCVVDAPPACLAQLREANERLWWTNTVPGLAVMAGGYFVVGAVAIRTWRQRRK